jgi:hypothetical protein
MEGSITVECELVCVGTYTEYIRVMWSPDGGGGPLLDTATNGFPIPGPVNGLPFHESVTFGPDGSVLSWSLGLQSRFPPGSFQAFYRTDTGENFANYGHEQFFSQAVGHGNPAGTWALASVPSPLAGNGLPGFLCLLLFLGGAFGARGLADSGASNSVAGRAIGYFRRTAAAT